MTLDSFITVYARYGTTCGRWPHKYAPVSDAEKKEAKKLVKEYARVSGAVVREEQFGACMYVSLLPGRAASRNRSYIMGSNAPSGETALDAYVFTLSEIALCAGIESLDELKIWLDIGGACAKRRD